MSPAATGNSKLIKARKARSTRGQLGSLVLLSLILVAGSVGSLAIDVSHVVSVQNDLQNAVEAAAISGAQSATKDPDNAEYFAIEVCAENTADGHPVSFEADDTSVEAIMNPGVGEELSTVQVTASTRVNHTFARLFNRNSDIVAATATAGAGASVRDLGGNQAFPLVISLDAAPGNNVNGENNRAGENVEVDEVPLNQKHIGDTVHFYINSQVFKNAAFTSFTESTANANYISSAVDQSLGLAEEIPGFIPQIEIGDQINLNNGIVAQRNLAQSPRLEMLTSMPVAIIPVITGDPAYNQSRAVVGFIAVKFDSVTVDAHGGVVETITGHLVPALVKGNGAQVENDNLVNEEAIDRLSPHVVQIIN